MRLFLPQHSRRILCRSALLLVGLFAIGNAPARANDGLIVFEAQDGGNTEIHCVQGDGTREKRLTNNAAYDGQPQLSPDGSKILYLSGKDADHTDIYSMNADGSGAKRLTDGKGYSSAPEFSSDGSRVVYLAKGNVYTMNSDGTGTKRLMTSGGAHDPIFSPDASQIAFDAGGDLCIMNSDGTNRRLPVAHQTNSYLLQQPRFSPDGSQVAFLQYARSSDSEKYTLSLLNLASSQSAELNSTENNFVDPAQTYLSGFTFSPDGANVLIRTDTVYFDPDIMQTTYTVGLYTIDVASRVSSRLYEGFSTSIAPITLCYSLDGKHVLFNPHGGYLETIEVKGNGYGYLPVGTLGSWGVDPGNLTPPVNVSLSPATSNSPGAALKIFTSIQRDPDGATDIEQSTLLINTSNQAWGGFMASYDSTKNLLYVYDETKNEWIGGLAPGSNNMVSTRLGSLSCSRTKAVRKGKTLTISWAITPRLLAAPGKALTLLLYLSAKDGSNTVNSDKMANWTITSPSLMNVAASMATPSSLVGETNTLNIEVQNSAGTGQEKITFLISANTSPAKALSGVIDIATKTVALYDDKGRTLGAPVKVGKAGAVVNNAQGALDIGLSRLKTNKTTIVASLVLKPSTSFLGTKTLILATLTPTQNTGRETFGAWAIGQVTAPNEATTPSLTTPSAPES